MRGEGRRGVAIVTAMGVESLGLARALGAGPWSRRLRRGWREGLVGNCPVVLATCGVGMKAARKWGRLLLREYEPSLVIVTGASGGVAPFVDVGDLVLAESIYWLDRRTLLARYAADPRYLQLAREAVPLAPLHPIRGHEPRVVEAGVASTGRAVGDRRWGAQLAQEHGAVAVEMEGAAIAEACGEQGVPFVAVRAVSDVIGRRWQWLTMIRNLVRVQRNAERLVLTLVQLLDASESC